MNNTYTDEITIDLMDMIFFFLRKWKVMVALLLVCAVLGGVYAALQPTIEPEAYVPDTATLELMEQAYQAREHYEKALASSGEDLTALNDGRTLVEALEKAFADDALTYYQVNYLGVEASEVVVTTASIAKYAVIGAFLGIVLWGVWYLVAYLVNPTVKTAEELSSYGITLLGRVAAEKQEKGLDKVLAAWQEKSKRPGTTTQYLAAVIDGIQGGGQMVLCGDQVSEDAKALMTALESECSKVKASSFISKSEEALKLVKQAQSEILVVQTWKTQRAQIQRELEMCRVQNVKILGVVVID